MILQKYCSKCKTYKPLNEFAWKKKKLNKKASTCKSCHKIYRDKYYKINKKREQKRITDRKKQLRLFIKDYKNNLKCNRCDENHPATLQFHHKDPTIKETEIATAVNRGWSIKRIINEIEKCEVLCANCHSKIHWS